MPARVHAGVLLGLELLELLGDLGPGAAGDLVPPPRHAVWAVPDRDRAVPAVLVDRSFVAPATPGAGTRLLLNQASSRLAPLLAHR
jgi:hypothetical protein